MLKYIYPILFICGLILGLYFLISGRDPLSIHREARGWKRIIFIAAAFLLGIFRPDGASGQAKSPESSLIGRIVPMNRAVMMSSLFASPPQKVLDQLRMRIELLEGLRQNGKLTEKAYIEILDQIQQDMKEIENTGPDRGDELKKAEEIVLSAREELNKAWLEEVGKEETWANLKWAWQELHLLIKGQQNQFNQQVVESSLAYLREKGLISSATDKAIGRLFKEVAYHYNRQQMTCYIAMPASASHRAEMTRLVEKIHANTLTENDSAMTLSRISLALICFDSQEQKCGQKVQSKASDRIALVETLSLLMSLDR